MYLLMMLLQVGANSKLPESAEESSFSFWIISEIVITAIIFIGVYFIFKPLAKKKDQENKD